MSHPIKLIDQVTGNVIGSFTVSSLAIWLIH